MGMVAERTEKMNSRTIVEVLLRQAGMKAVEVTNLRNRAAQLDNERAQLVEAAQSECAHKFEQPSLTTDHTHCVHCGIHCDAVN